MADHLFLLTHIHADPVLLCNELGAASVPAATPAADDGIVDHCGRADMSVKESVRIARANNLMGLVCASRLLRLVPALVSAVKEAGLVLMVDHSRELAAESIGVAALAPGVDGMVVGNAVMRFRDGVEQ